MLLKKKQESAFFDFTKKDASDKKTRFKKFLSKFLNAFIILHFVMGPFNMFQLENAKEKMQAYHNAMFNDYSELQKAMKAGEQDKAIYLFSKIKNYDNATVDLLLGTNILLINTPHHKDTPVEERMKLTPETIKTLQYIYSSSSGVEGEKNLINGIKCFYVDVACHIVMPHIKDKLIESTDIVASKIAINNYNISHMQEYQQWQKDFSAAIEKSQNGYDGIPEELKRNPGQKHMDALEKKS